MTEYPFLDKYHLSLEYSEGTSGTIITFVGKPDHPNGLMFSIIANHHRLKLRHFPRRLTSDEEISMIESIIRFGRPNERYPMVSEEGQIAIYKHDAFVYDTYRNGDVFGDFETLDDYLDDKDEEAVLVIPASDVLGILLDYKNLILNDESKA